MAKTVFELDCWEEDGVLYLKRDDLVSMLRWLKTTSDKVPSDVMLSRIIEKLETSPTLPTI